MPDKTGGVALYDLKDPLTNVKETFPLKGADLAADEDVIAIADGYFTGVSVRRYEGAITAGTIDFWCAKNGQNIGLSAQLGAGGTSAYRRLAADTYAFSAGDKLQAKYGTSSDYADTANTEFTVTIWFAYDY